MMDLTREQRNEIQRVYPNEKIMENMIPPLWRKKDKEALKELIKIEAEMSIEDKLGAVQGEDGEWSV